MKLPEGIPDPPAEATPQAGDIEGIYRALQQGRARESVDDANVDALIDLARERGDAQLELLLREWRSPCGDDPQSPDAAQVQGLPPPG